MGIKIGDEVEYTSDKINEPLSFNKPIKKIGKVIWIEKKDKNLPYQKVKVDSTITTMKDINKVER